MTTRTLACSLLSGLFPVLVKRLNDNNITTTSITLQYIFKYSTSGYYATPVLSWTSTNVNWILAITGFGLSITYPSTQGTARFPLQWHLLQFFQHKELNDDFTLRQPIGLKDDYNFLPRLHQIFSNGEFKLHDNSTTHSATTTTPKETMKTTKTIWGMKQRLQPTIQMPQLLQPTIKPLHL